MAKSLDGLLDRFDTCVITSEVSREEQSEIGKKWRNGGYDAMLSSTSGLVGNENPRCKHVIISGRIYSLMNLVQGAGRLRPSQRESSGSIDIYLPCLSNERRAEIIASDLSNKQRLLAKGLITDDIADSFDRVCTTLSIDNWAMMDGCRLVALYDCFGLVRNKCHVCDLCSGTAVSTTARAATATLSAETALQDEADPFFVVLMKLCVYCGSDSCDGQSCLRGCFLCGGNHLKPNCRFQPKRVLQNIGCNYCYDLHCRPGYTFHKPEDGCPLQRRLRRLLIDAHQQLGGSQSFEEFLRETATAKAKFYSVVIETAKRLLSNRRYVYSCALCVVLLPFLMNYFVDFSLKPDCHQWN
jgi:hypothetical protein